jgi:hypothetical protein
MGNKARGRSRGRRGAWGGGGGGLGSVCQAEPDPGGLSAGGRGDLTPNFATPRIAARIVTGIWERSGVPDDTPGVVVLGVFQVYRTIHLAGCVAGVTR